MPMVGEKAKNSDVSDSIKEKTNKKKMEELNIENLRIAVYAWIDESNKNSMARIAREVGVTRQTMYNILDGTHDPSLGKIRKILSVIEVESGIYKKISKKK